MFENKFCHFSTSSSDGNTNSSDDESSLNTNESQISVPKRGESVPIIFESLFPTMSETYGTKVKPLKKSDEKAYKM